MVEGGGDDSHTHGTLELQKVTTVTHMGPSSFKKCVFCRARISRTYSRPAKNGIRECVPCPLRWREVVVGVGGGNWWWELVVGAGGGSWWWELYVYIATV